MTETNLEAISGGDDWLRRLGGERLSLSETGGGGGGLGWHLFGAAGQWVCGRPLGRQGGGGGRA